MQAREFERHLVVALIGVLAVGTAQAQSRRMPVRTQEVPDTESGRPAASAERPTFKGRLLIYGPQSLPVTPPPEHVKPAPAEQAPPIAAPSPTASPTPSPTPSPAPAPVAAPAPKPEAAPVVTPVTPPPAPVATPIPAPPPPVAKPESAPATVAKPAPVAEPVPVAKPEPPKPVPVAKPEPIPEPPVAKPAPVVVAPAPVATPTPPPAPAPVIAAPAPVREPVVRIETPKPAPPAPAPAAPPRQEVALAAPSSSVATPAAPIPIEMKEIESIFTCLAPGLPQDWSKAWVEITDAGSGKEKVSKFFFSTLRGDKDGEPLVPCNAQELTRRIIGLNNKLPADRRSWSRALLVIDSDGEYELSYEYPK